MSDDEKVSRDVKFRFIKNGLDKRILCIYDTWQGKPIEYEMIKYGINVKLYKIGKLIYSVASMLEE